MLAVLVPAPAGSAAEAGAAGKVTHTRDTFPSADRPVAVERFEPAAPGTYPAVVLLHALDGLDNSYGLVYRLAAERCAARGYVVVLVHYFDRTATGQKELPALREPFLRWARGEEVGDAERGRMAAHFDAWSEAVRDAVRYTRGRPNVDGARVGLVGFSLGGFLALAAAADEGLHIAAVAEFFGGLPEGRRGRLRSLPPALVIHGDQDRTVPVNEARRLGDWLAAHDSPGQVKIYPGVDHVFMKPRGGFDWDALRDAQERAAAFLDRHLKGAAAEGHVTAAVGR